VRSLIRQADARAVDGDRDAALVSLAALARHDPALSPLLRRIETQDTIARLRRYVD
jgi:hypothetical protein